jgi:predicted ATPase
MQPPVIHRIVLTGGPCAGKSTALHRIAGWLRACGIRVYHLPEASTLLLPGGIVVAGAPLEQMVTFQTGIVRVQLALEEAFGSFARAAGRHAVLLCDRGVVDGAAYLPAEGWSRVLLALGLSEGELRTSRYDVVVHMVTAALGAEAFYGTATNVVRYESLEEARQVDERLRQAWRWHPNQRVIDNASDFEGKLRRVVSVVCEVVGVPEPALA